jgi:PIN domain nuclease of toxin-antitoxin system
VWIVEGREHLEQHGCGRRRGSSLSALSMCEIAMLEARGRIRFDIPCLDWVEKATGLRGLSLVPLTPSIAVNATRLPGDFHGDPADRIIVATARAVGGVLVTRDAKITEYAAAG